MFTAVSGRNVNKASALSAFTFLPSYKCKIKSNTFEKRTANFMENTFAY